MATSSLFVPCPFGFMLKNHQIWWYKMASLHCPQGFPVSDLCLCHAPSEVGFIIDLRWGSSFIPLHLSFQVSQHHLWKRLSFRSCLGILSFDLVWKGGDQLSSMSFFNLVPTSPPHPPLPTPHCISYSGVQNVHLGCSFGIPCAFQIFFFQKCPWGFDKGHTESVNCTAKILNWLQTLFSLFLAMRFSMQFVHGSVVTLILFLHPENNIYILLPTFSVNNKPFKFWPKDVPFLSSSVCFWQLDGGWCWLTLHRQCLYHGIIFIRMGQRLPNTGVSRSQRIIYDHGQH